MKNATLLLIVFLLGTVLYAQNSPVPAGLNYTVSGSSVTITRYAGTATTLNIPGQIEGLPVTAIRDGAFSGCSSLASVSIPSSVTSIGSSAFYGCVNLNSVTIPSSVTSIGTEAFFSCAKLTSVTIPSSVTSIGSSAFYACDNLTSVTLSRRTQVGNMAFPATARISYSD